MTGSPKIKGVPSSLGKEIYNYIKQANNNVKFYRSFNLFIRITQSNKSLLY